MPRASRLAAALTGGALVLATLSGPVAAAAAAAPSPSDKAGAEVVEGRVLVTWQPGARASERQQAREQHGLRTEKVVPSLGVEALQAPGNAPDHVAQRLAKHPAVKIAEPDHVLRATATNDPYYGDLWGLENSNDVDVDAPEAWTHTTGSSDVVVAVVDTGTEVSHPDLQGNLWTNPGEIAGNGTDDDGNGYPDDVHGWDFRTGDASVYDGADEDAHGTHVAGTIAAVGGNRTGIVGVAPDVRIMPLKFLGGTDGSGSTLDAAEAIQYAADNGATIVNASWAGGSSTTLKNVIATTGIAVVAAAGNSGLDLDTEPSYPAAWAADVHGLPNVLSVASVDKDGSLSSFSNVGRTTVDVGAPGSSILSTLPDAKYGWMSGTSMAAPHAAGVAALVASLHPGFSGAELVEAVKDSAQPLASLATVTTTGDLVNAAEAIAPYATPGAPTNVTATPGHARATVAWQAPADGGTPSSYAVTVTPTTDVTGDTTRTVAAGTTSLDFTGLAAGTDYSFTVTATNTSGTSVASAPSAPVTPTATLPGAPTGISVQPGDRQLVVSWAAPSDDGGATVDGYTVTVTPEGGDPTVLSLTATDGDLATSATVTDLTNGTPHTVTVAASNAVGSGPASTSLTSTPRTVPDAPTDVTATAGEEQASVAWTAPASDGGNPITSYTVTAAPSGATTTVKAPATTATVTGLASGVETTFTVTATSAAGTSAPSTSSAPVMPTAPPAPTLSPAPAPAPAPEPAPAPADDPLLEDDAPLEDEAPLDGDTTLVDDPVLGEEPALRDDADAPGVEPATACPVDRVPAGGFSDVGDGVHAPAIDCVTWWGVANGLTTTTYGPTGKVTRGQMASFIARSLRASGVTLPAGRDRFSDDDGGVHEPDIDALAAAGVVNGIAPGQYAPGRVVTRGEMATFLVRAHELATGVALTATSDPFTDDEGGIHEGAINAAYDAGLVRGTGTTTYDPTRAVVRAEMATFLSRLLDGWVAADVANTPV